MFKKKLWDFVNEYSQLAIRFTKKNISLSKRRFQIVK